MLGHKILFSFLKNCSQNEKNISLFSELYKEGQNMGENGRAKNRNIFYFSPSMSLDFWSLIFLSSPYCRPLNKVLSRGDTNHSPQVNLLDYKSPTKSQFEDRFQGSDKALQSGGLYSQYINSNGRPSYVVFQIIDFTDMNIYHNSTRGRELKKK